MTYPPLTFLFTDLEGSTRLWEQFPDIMRAALERHDALLKKAVKAHHGRIVKTTGDGLHAVFETPSDGVAAALAGQQAITAESWPETTGSLKVRMGLHTGESQEREGDYYGPTLNRAARIMATGFGGQILLSSITANLSQKTLPADATLLDLGEHCLRDLAQPEHLYQLCHPALPPNFPPLKSLSSFKNNLPVQLTSFIGREKELEQVKQLLSPLSLEGRGAGGEGGVRLLTLLGPGGTGKTRLMLQAAADLVDQFPDGVWFIELAPLTDPDLLPAQVANVLQVREQPGRRLLDSLVDYLRRKELLLLFDNVEHLVRESAELAEHLLMHCPSIKILVTGREALFIGGETNLQIPSLSLPKKESLTLDLIANSEAVQLFLARAQAVRPDFVLTPDNAAALAEVVRRLDGIPLALELAAARLPMLSVEQIAARLNDRFRLLTGGRRTALPRQQTLQALIDWSWNLLNDEERTLLRRLSVFAGGWTLEAAEAISNTQYPISAHRHWILDILSSLINKSLVMAEQPPEGEVRYRMLESIRQYAQERLLEAGEGEALRDRHAAYFAVFVQEAENGLWGQGTALWAGRLSQEMDNFRTALEWTVERNPDLALVIAGKLFTARGFRHSLSEARRWLEQVIERAQKENPTTAEVTRQTHLGVALAALSGVNFAQGRNAEGVVLGEEAVRILRSTGNLRELCYALGQKAFVATFAGQWEVARTAAEEAVALSGKHYHPMGYFQSLATLVLEAAFSGDFGKAATYLEEQRNLAKQMHDLWMDAQTAQLEGRFFRFQGNLKQAQAAFERAAQLFGAIKDFSFAMITKSEVSHLMRQQGNFSGALPIYRETILGILEAGNLGGVAHQLECFGYIAVAMEEPERAAKLLGAARELREQAHAESVFSWEKSDFAQAMAQLTEILGDPARDAAMAEGRAMSVDEAVAFALEETTS